METNAKLTPDLLSSPPKSSGAPFDVVALVGSAGGPQAMSTILHGLPAGFPATVFVALHLGQPSNALAKILSRDTHLPVDWAEDGMPVPPGHVIVCPPRKLLEIFPDGTCALRPSEQGALDKPFEAFLESLADSFGPRSLAVILTGMGKDGAAGARALKRAGGAVIVQSEETAQEPSMPRTALEVGAADLVLSLAEIGPTLVATIFGRELAPRHARPLVDALLAGPGEAQAALRAIRWSGNALGRSIHRPQSLRTMASTVLASNFPMCIFWGLE